MNERVRRLIHQAVVGGLASESDGVAFGLSAIAPAIEHGQDNWFGSFDHHVSRVLQQFLPCRGHTSQKMDSSFVLSRYDEGFVKLSKSAEVAQLTGKIRRCGNDFAFTGYVNTGTI